MLVVVIVVVLVDEDGLDDLDVLLGRRGLRERHRHGEDAAVVGGVDVVLVGADGQRDGPHERSVRELRVAVRFAGLGALGLDRQLAVADGDLDVVDRVDAGKFCANLVQTFPHLVLQLQQVAVEERTQTRDRRQAGERRKPVEKLGQLGQQGTRLTLDGRLIHNSSRIFARVDWADGR